MAYPIVDAHQHFWKYDPVRDGWITDEMKLLQQDYLPADLNSVFNSNNIAGSVLVQADPSENENRFLVNLALENSCIRGVVGWIDLNSESLQERLEYYQAIPVMKGFRMLLQGDKKRDAMLDPGFQKGIGLLGRYGFSFDLLILPDQIGFAEKLAAAFPNQRFVIDHLAKPFIKSGKITEWKSAIQRFAPLENVCCKISGLVTEADWLNWEYQDFKPYIDTVVDTFGTKRIMFGSDWPVCLTAGEYAEVKEIADEYFRTFTLTERADFFGANAMSFYNLT
jgi:L-fuconolactonase